MTTRPIDYLLRRADAAVFFFYGLELAVELVEELFVTKARDSKKGHGEYYSPVCARRTKKLTLLSERKHGLSFSFFEGEWAGKNFAQ
jgi:hypothetical protein